jgi:hypothetical protein
MADDGIQYIRGAHEIMRIFSEISNARMAAAVLSTLCATVGAAVAQNDVYPTYGVHNPPSVSPCVFKDCVYKRSSGEPSDPSYPPYWTSNWRMYRVFNRFAEFPPPYDGAPPAPLKEGRDYELSHGATYYDDTWRGPTGEGAMMEHYEKRCLPIFPIPNTYSCSFISLGDIAFFVTYPEDRPKDMPPVCLFSPNNHPPRRNFIEHLPYAKGDSDRLQGRVQGYSFWIGGDSGKPIQTGVSPDQTLNGGIMFGYAFESASTPDRADPAAAPYRHPQSFYFSGVYNSQEPTMPPDAPIVSQNYTDFAMVKPDPAKTWDQVAKLDPKTLPACRLFNPPNAAASSAYGKAGVRTWADIGRKR